MFREGRRYTIVQCRHLRPPSQRTIPAQALLNLHTTTPPGTSGGVFHAAPSPL
ncbi:hypothetical protein [Nonomuraea angiospora]